MGMRTPFVFFGALALSAIPFTALAAVTDFFGPIIPQSGVCLCDTAMDWGCVLQVFQGVLNVLVSIGVLAVVFFIAWGGFMLITGGSNPSVRQQAKNRMLNAVVGLVIILGAWIIVDTVMKVLYNPDTSFEGGTFGPWNQIIFSGNEDNYCVKVNKNPGILNDGSLVDVIKDVIQPGTGGSSSGGSGGGSCTVKSTGPCSAAVLGQTCFASRAQEAARICNLESGGNPSVKSGSDRLNGGSGPSYSVGLWQINLTVHKVGGLDCPSAFTKSCGSGNGSLVGPSKPGACTSTITDMALYNRCVVAAQNPNLNSAVACKLYTQSGRNGGFQPWAYSANKCSVSTSN